MVIANMLNHHKQATIVFLLLTSTIVGCTNISESPLVLGSQSDLSSSQIYALVNQRRAEMDVTPLIYDPVLEGAAEAKARHMIEFGYWDHQDPLSGTQPWDFIQEAGYEYIYAGENLARGFDDSGKLVQGWMNSVSHRQTLLDARYSHTGIAAIEYTNEDDQLDWSVVQLLATPYDPHLHQDLEPSYITFAPLISRTYTNPWLWLALTIPSLLVFLYILKRNRPHKKPPSDSMWVN